MRERRRGGAQRRGVHRCALLPLLRPTRFEAAQPRAKHPSAHTAAPHRTHSDTYSSAGAGEDQEAASPQRAAPPLPQGGRIDPSLLELPGNAEATIRLLKARVRALEEQLQTAADAAAGARLLDSLQAALSKHH